jgi:hypothetical protein
MRLTIRANNVVYIRLREKSGHEAKGEERALALTLELPAADPT